MTFAAPFIAYMYYIQTFLFGEATMVFWPPIDKFFHDVLFWLMPI